MWLHGLHGYGVRVGLSLRLPGDFIQLKVESASGGPSLSLRDRSRSGVYTDPPKLRGTFVHPASAAEWAPEWSPALRGPPPLSVCVTDSGRDTQGGRNYWLPVILLWTDCLS